MTRSLILFLCLLASMYSKAQLDSNSKIKKAKPVNKIQQPPNLTAPQTPSLTTVQKQWLDNNYKILGSIKKDSAESLIRKNYPGIAEASIEYFISQAGKLLSGDKQNQIAQLTVILNQLKVQKQALVNKINSKETQQAASTDPVQKEKLNNEILQLKNQLKIVEDKIAAQMEAIRRLEAGN